MRTLFHITPKAAWQKAVFAGAYKAPSLVTEGFIHFSRPHQVSWVAEKFFKNQNELVVLQVNQEKLEAALKYEGADGQVFPHLYGPLNLEAVVGVFDFDLEAWSLNGLGAFTLLKNTMLRVGLVGDEAEICNVFVHAWQQSYQNIMPSQFLVDRPLEFYSLLQKINSHLKEKTPTRFWVAESEQQGIVAAIAVGSARDEQFPGYGEIRAINCLSQYKDMGIGQALFNQGLRHLQTTGYAQNYLWVLKDNLSAIRFYEKLGGKNLGIQKKQELGGKILTEVAYGWG